MKRIRETWKNQANPNDKAKRIVCIAAAAAVAADDDNGDDDSGEMVR